MDAECLKVVNCTVIYDLQLLCTSCILTLQNDQLKLFHKRMHSQSTPVECLPDDRYAVHVPATKRDRYWKCIPDWFKILANNDAFSARFQNPCSSGLYLKNQCPFNKEQDSEINVHSIRNSLEKSTDSESMPLSSTYGIHLDCIVVSALCILHNEPCWRWGIRWKPNQVPLRSQPGRCNSVLRFGDSVSFCWTDISQLLPTTGKSPLPLERNANCPDGLSISGEKQTIVYVAEAISAAFSTWTMRWKNVRNWMELCKFLIDRERLPARP